MGDFKRSPSKVWWNEETSSWRLQASASPGSQDSGFSDTETFPTHQKNILRELSKDTNNDTSKNKSSEYQEKCLPEKNLSFCINAEKLNKALELQRKPLYQKRSRKNLFKSDDAAAQDNHQYANNDNNTKRHQISIGVTFDDSNVLLQESTQQRLNRSAPAALEVLKENEDERVDEASDCDSEIENLFRGAADSPRHTSTPKAGRQDMRQCKRKAALNLHQQQMKWQRERYVRFVFEK